MFKPGLRNKLIFFFLPLMFGMLIQGGFCIYTFSVIHDHFEGVQKDAATDVSAMLKLRRLLISLEQGIRKHQIDPGQIREKARQLDKLIREHSSHKHETLASASDQAAHETLHHAIFATTLSKYILERLRTDQAPDPEELSNIADTIQEELAVLAEVNDQHLQQHIDTLTKTELFISEQYRHALVVIAVTSVAVLILTVAVFYFLVRSVLGPVNILVQGTQQIASGNMDVRLDINSGDEFELLAREFTSMAKKLDGFHQELDSKVQERTRELVRANEELKRAEEQIHNLSRQLLAVQESERQQISLYLHDDVAQNLSSLKIACDSLLMDVTQGRVPDNEEIRNWRELLDHCIKTVRELSYNLRPPCLEQIGLASALSDYCRDFSRKTGISALFHGAGVEDLELEFETAINIYRLVQEALNNVMKHSGATVVRVGLVASYPDIILTVEDNGQGFDPEDGYRKALNNKCLGLLGMKERVRTICGTLRLHSAPGHGTKITVRFPVAPEESQNK